MKRGANLGKLLFERSKTARLSIPHQESAKRTKLHLFGILGAIIGIIAAVGIIFVLTTQMKGEAPAQVPPKAEEQPTQAQIVRPLCNEQGTSLLCMCSAERNIVGSCSVKPLTAALNFYSSPVETGVLIGYYSSDDYWSCSWNKMEVFSHFVPSQNLCGDADAQNKFCEEAAKTRPECNILPAQIEVIDNELQQCELTAKNSCTGEHKSTDIVENLDASSLEGGPIEETS